MAREVEVLRDAGQKRPRRVREGGDAEARGDLLGHRRASDDLAALEDEGFVSGLREVGCRDEAVVPAPDDDDAPGASRHQPRTLPRRQSSSIFVAALRPGAPMIPPPGCVAEPHM